MNPSNLPPGCESHMIPGNRPEDAEWDLLIEEMIVDWGLSPAEIRRRVLSPLWNKNKKGR